MAVLKNNEYKTPFWGEQYNFIRGLDPLGMQISSETIYGDLLPGITNLTARIRYFGLYCWLLNEYAERIHHTSKVQQYNYIRKAELLIALMMQANDPNITQIAGSSFAEIWVHKEKRQEFDLAKGAEIKNNSTDDTYWKLKKGAFGQYYVGAMNSLGLVGLNESGNYICTTDTLIKDFNGKALAFAFNKSIKEPEKELFLYVVEKGKVSLQECKHLFLSFNMVEIPFSSFEREFYIKLLLNSDMPIIYNDINESFNRRNTVKAFLQHINDNANNTTRSFLRSVYDFKGVEHNIPKETSKLWFAYILNDLWQYTNLSTFEGILIKLIQESSIITFNDFIGQVLTNISMGINLYFKETVNRFETLQVSEMIEAGVYEILDEIQKTKDSFKILSYSILLTLNLYKENIEYISSINFIKTKLKDGNVIEGFDWIKNNLSKPFDTFVKDFILHFLIYRHQMVALRKMGNGTQTTLKFLIEGGLIKGTGVFGAQFTSPRLGSLFSILKDLKFLDEKNLLSYDAKELIKENADS